MATDCSADTCVKIQMKVKVQKVSILDTKETVDDIVLLEVKVSEPFLHLLINYSSPAND